MLFVLRLLFAGFQNVNRRVQTAYDYKIFFNTNQIATDVAFLFSIF